MKLILESAVTLDSSIEDELNEASGQSERNYYISGIFSTPEVKNRNGRIYPRNIWEREVQNYQKEINEKTINSLGELEHPTRSNVDPMKAVIRIVELKMTNEGNVWGKAKILNDNSEATNKLKGLIKEGIKIGVSTRGVGKVNSRGIVEDYRLITTDVVAQPSDFNANLNGLHEGVMLIEGIVQDKDYEILDNGCIGEACTLTTEGIYKNEFLIESLLEDTLEEVLGKPKKDGKDNIYTLKDGSKAVINPTEKNLSISYTDIEGKVLGTYKTFKDFKKELLKHKLINETLKEKCPIQEKINEAVRNAEKAIYIKIEEKMSLMAEAIDKFISESFEVQADKTQDTIEEGIYKNSISEEQAKKLIEALKNKG